MQFSSPGNYPQDPQLAARQRILEQVRGQFARFGDDVCDLIASAALKPHGISALLAQLHIQPVARFESQLLALVRYLTAAGTAQFLAAAHPAYRREKPGAAGGQRHHPEAVLHTGIKLDDTATRRSKAARAAALQATQPATEVTPAVPQAPAAPPTAPTPASPAAPQAAPPPTGETPVQWFDALGQYIGPERRGGGERRKGRDRRDRIDLIARNHRFGGDRRKERRRRND